MRKLRLTAAAGALSLSLALTAVGIPQASAAPIALSLNKAVNGSIASNAETDWFNFTAPTTGTYTFELFNVATSTDGVILESFDPSGKTYYSQIATPSYGNVDKDVQFTITSGQVMKFSLRTGSNGGTGSYQVRVLPQYNQNGGVVRDATHEPNNTRSLAVPIGLGREKAITSQFNAYPGTVISHSNDIDWFAFNAPKAGSYTVELFDVAQTASGLSSVKVFNSKDESVDRDPISDLGVGTGRVRSRVEFSAPAPGTFYLKTDALVGYGSYSLRVLPNWDMSMSRDKAGEPNDTFPLAPNATLGIDVDSSLEAIPSTVQAGFSDHDYFRYSLKAGQKMTAYASSSQTHLQIEVLNARDDSQDFDSCEVGERCQVDFTAPTAGDYYLAVLSSKNIRGGGIYQACMTPAGTICQPATGLHRFHGTRPAATDKIGEATGDALADVWALSSTGTLDFFKFGNPTMTRMGVRGTGLNHISYIGAVPDQNGDRRADLFYRDSRDNSLWFAYSTGNGYLTQGRRIGSNWGAMDQIFYAGNMIAGSNQQYMLARNKNDGSLWRYRISTGGLYEATKVGTGWNGMRIMLAPGNMTGDAAWDVIGIHTNGSMYRFRSYGGGNLVLDKQVGYGWQSTPVVFAPGDITNDGRIDLIGRRTDGTLWSYRNDPTGFYTIGKIGTGFTNYGLMA